MNISDLSVVEDTSIQGGLLISKIDEPNYLDNITVEPYAALLRTLVDEHGVTDFWDGAGGGTPTDGVVKTQIICDPASADAVEAAVRASGLRLADEPVVLREN